MPVNELLGLGVQTTPTNDLIGLYSNMSKGKPYRNVTQLDPQQEQQFQSWAKTLPPNLQSDTEAYDLRGAFVAGVKPTWDESTKSYHLPSRDPTTGKILKSVSHPTFNYTIKGEADAGYEIYYDDKTNRYYSRKKK